MPFLGCIADDFTGGTDLAGMLVKHGMRTVQMIGVPQAEPRPAVVDALSNQDLAEIGAACADLRLVTARSKWIRGGLPTAVTWRALRLPRAARAAAADYRTGVARSPMVLPAPLT